MKQFSVRKYSSSDKQDWNDFVSKAKNATFLFHRDFMDYHQDRFEDYSLIIEDDKNWVALLPANRVGDMLFSHQGLTYGGLVLKNSFGGSTVISIFECLLNYLKNHHFKNFKIKPILPFYAGRRFIEIECSLIQKNANLYRKDMNLFIDFKSDYTISKSKLKHFRRVSALGLEIRKDNKFHLFWNDVLIPRLKEKYSTKPVHSVDEILYLHAKFPQNIEQYNVYFNNEIIAGITLFVFKHGIKSQYGATTSVGEKMRALDFLFISLIHEFKDKFSFFDMGTVSENEGKSFNKGLLKQKEELGCTISVQDYYSLEL